MKNLITSLTGGSSFLGGRGDERVQDDKRQGGGFFSSDSFSNTPQLPVTKNGVRLNSDRSTVKISRNNTPTLSASEMLQAPSEQAAPLLERYGRYLGLLASTAAQTTGGQRPDAFEASRDGFSAKVTKGSIEISDGQRSVKLTDGAPEISGKLEEGLHGFLMTAFENLLVTEAGKGHPTAKDVDANVAQLYLHLLGPQGVMAQGGGEAMISGKLLAYDLNGTAEHREGMAGTTDALNAMGAVSIITTTIGAEGAERAMDQAKAPFTGYHGGSEVRPSGGNKHYAPVSAAYGIPASQLKHQLAVIGDSETDAPGDVKDVLFVHNSNRTPAEALQVLFTELDRLGEGSFYDATQKLLGKNGRGSAELGPLKFDLGMTRRKGETGPTISNLKVSFTFEGLGNGLMPGSTESSSIQALAKRHLGRLTDGSFADGVSLLVSKGVDLSGEIASRTNRRRETVAWAQQEASSLLQEAKKMGYDDFAEAAKKVADIGDDKALNTLKAAVVAFSKAETSRSPKRLQQDRAFAEEVGTKVADLINGDEPVPFKAATGWRDTSAPERIRSILGGHMPRGRRDSGAVMTMLDGASRLQGTKYDERDVDMVPAADLRGMAEALTESAERYAAGLNERLGALDTLLESGAASVRTQEDVWARIGEGAGGK